MGAAWREPKDADFDRVCEMVRGVDALGLEACATLGMLDAARRGASRRRASRRTTTTSTRRRSTTARSSPRAPTRIASTRSSTCATPASTSAAAASSAWARAPRTASACSRRSPTRPASRERADQRAGDGRGHAARGAAPLDPLDLVRTIAAARILHADVAGPALRGPRGLSEEAQALCFLAGANSIFFGDRSSSRRRTPSATATCGCWTSSASSGVLAAR